MAIMMSFALFALASAEHGCLRKTTVAPTTTLATTTPAPTTTLATTTPAPTTTTTTTTTTTLKLDDFGLGSETKLVLDPVTGEWVETSHTTWDSRDEEEAEEQVIAEEEVIPDEEAEVIEIPDEEADVSEIAVEADVADVSDIEP